MNSARGSARASRAPEFISRALLTPWLAAIVMATGCDGSSGGGGSGVPTAPIVPGVTTANTDAQGVAAMTDESGDTLIIVQAYDDGGNPLDDIDVVYWEASPDPLVGFTIEGSGAPAGFFFVELEATPAMAASNGRAAENPPNAGVFILSRLDPTLSRLFDEKQDGFTPDFVTTLRRIREVVGAEAVYAAIQSAPGVQDLGIKSKRALLTTLTTAVDLCLGLGSGSIPPNLRRMILRRERLVEFSEGQHDEYRYRAFKVREVGTGDRTFLIPLGLDTYAQITAPVTGTRYTDEEDRRRIAVGTIDPDAAAVLPDHGRLELRLNGMLIPDLAIESNEISGLWRSLGFDLEDGENTLELLAFVEEKNAGIETPVDGRVGEDVVTLTFEPGAASPVLSNLTYDPTAACPDGEFAMAYHFEDPDGDALTLHLRVAFDVGGPDSTILDIPVHSAGAECMQGFVGDCELTVFIFENFDGGETVTARVWVEDAAGNESNILIADYLVTGNCTSLRRSAERRKLEVFPRY